MSHRSRKGRAALNGYVMVSLFPMATAAFALLAAGPARAAECTGDTTMRMLECAGERLRGADGALNRDYARLVEAARREDRAGAAYVRPPGDTWKGHEEALRAAQRAWVTFRDRECDLHAAGFVGGTLHPVVHTECLARLTGERARTLGELAETSGRPK